MRREIIGLTAGTAILTGCSTPKVEVASPQVEQQIIGELGSGVNVYPGAFTAEPSSKDGLQTIVRGFVEIDGSFGCDPSVPEIDGSESQLGGIYAVDSEGILQQVTEWPRNAEFRTKIGQKTVHCVTFNPHDDGYVNGELPHRANFDGQLLRIAEMLPGDVGTNRYALEPLLQ